MRRENRVELRRAVKDCVKLNRTLSDCYFIPNQSVEYVKFCVDVAATETQARRVICVGSIVYGACFQGELGEGSEVHAVERDPLAIVMQQYFLHLVEEGFSPRDIQRAFLLTCSSCGGNYDPRILQQRSRAVSLLFSSYMPLTPVSEDDVEFARTTFNQFLESEVGFVPPNLFERAFQLKKVDGGSLPTLNPCVDTIPSWTEAHKDIDMEEPTTHYADFLDLDLGLRKADFLHTNNAIEHNPYQKFLERSAKVLNSGGVLELTITWKNPTCQSVLKGLR